MGLFGSKEKKHLAFTVIVLTLVFAFNDKRPSLEMGYWLGNFLKVFVIVLASVVLHELAHKLMASRYGFTTEHRTWGVKGLGWKKEPSFPRTFKILGKKFEVDSFPVGAVVGLVVMLFSNGNLYFAALEKYELKIERIGRFGKKFVNITDYEEAKIAVMGPLVNVLLAIIFSLFGTGGVMGQAVLINSLLAVFHMLPLPGLDGFKVLAGSIPLYIFTVAFIAGVGFLVKFIGPAFALVLAALLAVMLVFLFFYFSVYK